MERCMLGVTEADHLNVVHGDRTASRRYVSRWACQNTRVSTGKRAFFDSEIPEDLSAFDIDMPIRKGHKPALVKCGAGHLSMAAHSWRFEIDIVRHQLSERIYIMRIKRVGPRLEHFTHGHFQNLRQQLGVRKHGDSPAKRAANYATLGVTASPQSRRKRRTACHAAWCTKQQWLGTAAALLFILLAVWRWIFHIRAIPPSW